ncbi:hypothetical protein NL108_005381 [Boleophthalmus pectinirostris]|nr:hypothetical protein NL108_005381 [Boleophthalmus pectinirostris]
MESEDRCCFSKRRVLPPYSSRTLYHPSFMSLYSDPRLMHRHGDNQTVHPMIPQEFFYTDPTVICGTRIPNHVNELKDFDCFQLNTPPPIMSACLAPPNHSDPFRTGQHHIRNLGCSSWEMGPIPPPVNRMRVVLQLTQEEDQTITNLLKLHHGEEKLFQSEVETLQVDSEFIHAPHNTSAQANEQMNRHFARSRVDSLGKLRKLWSDKELEVANTLLTHFSATSEGNSVKSDGCNNVLLSDINRNVKDLTDFPADRVLSRSEGDALCGLLNLGLAQT